MVLLSPDGFLGAAEDDFELLFFTEELPEFEELFLTLLPLLLLPLLTLGAPASIFVISLTSLY